MTLLSVCQDVADVVGLTRPTAIVNGTDQLSKQMLGIAKEVLEELSLMDWPALQVPYSFNTVVGTSAYPLPSDFGHETADTCFLASQYYLMRGSLTPGDWQRQRNALPSQIGRYKFRLWGTPLMLNMYPTPGTVETVVLEYHTTNRVKHSDGTYGVTFSLDDDVSVVSETLLKKGLKWRIKRAKGLDYSEEFNEYEFARMDHLAKQLTLGSMPVAYRNNIVAPELSDGYVPEFGFGQ